MAVEETRVMRLPRFTIRRLMITTAAVAILLIFEPARRRRALCLDRPAYLAWTEEMCRAAIPLKDVRFFDPLLGDGAMSKEEALAEVAPQRTRYEYAASHPWLPVPLEPK